jgi:hypothetical protein
MPVKSRLRKPPPKSALPPKPAATSFKVASRSPSPRKKPAAPQSKPTGPHPGRGSAALEERVPELEAERKKTARRLRQEVKKRGRK